MRIRRVDSEDLEEIIVLNRCAQLSEWSLASYCGLFRNENTDFRVAEEIEGGRLLGFYLSVRTLSELELLKIAVLPNAQRQGIGASLLQECLQVGLENGCEVCYLEVRSMNESAIRLYKRYGFRSVGVRRNYYTLPLEDGLIMAKNLVLERDPKG